MSHPHENSIKAASHKYKTVTQELLDSGALNLKPTTKPYSGNSQLLMDYRAALIKAYDLGEDIKILYGIVPPKVLHDKSWPQLDSNYPTNRFTIGLTIS